MIFVLNLLTIVYLYFQRYIHNGILNLAFTPNSLSDFFYIFELIVFTVYYLLNNKKNPLALLFSVTNILLIILVELFRLSSLFSKQYFVGYPLSKTITAALYFLIFSISLFITLYYVILVFEENFSFLRTIVLEVVILVILLISGIYYNLSYEDEIDFKKIKKPYDYAVVLGAAVNKNKPYPIFRERIKKALWLFQNKYVQNILLTGAAAPNEESEAKVAYDFLLKRNVPEKNLKFEQNTTTTFEQIRFIDKFFKNKNKKIIVVSDKFHLRRVLEMARFLGIEISTVSSRKIILQKNLIYYRFRDSLALLLFLFFAI